MNRRTQQNLVTTILAIAIVAILVWQLIQKSQQPTPGPTGPTGEADPSVHLALGNPSSAKDNPADADNFLMRKKYFALSYNNGRGEPNWVSWRLQAQDLGKAPRASKFVPDMELPLGFHRVEESVYKSTGFDKGHMCPHADRGSSEEASTATFVMTNIIPQSPACNQHGWERFETYCRELVKKNDRTLYIVSGPHGKGGEGKNGPKDSLGGGRVTVPAECWKVVLVVDNARGDATDAGRVTSSARLIAVVMPNDQTVGDDWAKYRTSAKRIEEMTGYHFFDRVPAAVIDPLKAKVDDEHITPSHSR